MLQINALDQNEIIFRNSNDNLYTLIEMYPLQNFKRKQYQFYCNLMKKHLDLWGRS